ncbi:hypothetical protein JWG39_00825 [Desulforhopalus vacuolatus]|uniref:hypothetical protein n=1 Tax=Desulforhopalus vacuolatus TaxID=40414 RepID=UPI0019651477|nr:hypothetical protein [Desulforhopalus vacuolatus]MBM9518356.1 hypothetical protein [Desulforhopalus vacuolatus]
MKQKAKPSLVNLIQCPKCGNSEKFFEVVDNIVETTWYTQNKDGSFILEESNFRHLGPPRLFCAVCEEDLTAWHQRFSEMIF